MAIKKISVFKKQIITEPLSHIKEIAVNKYRVYAVNAQKAAKQILKDRKKKK